MKGIKDYDIEKAKISNNENEVYKDNVNFIKKDIQL